MVWIWEVNFCILVVPEMQSIAGSRGLPKWVPSEMGVGGDFGGEIEIWGGEIEMDQLGRRFQNHIGLVM